LKSEILRILTVLQVSEPARTSLVFSRLKAVRISLDSRASMTARILELARKFRGTKTSSVLKVSVLDPVSEA
jgi:hypothetical protein